MDSEPQLQPIIQPEQSESYVQQHAHKVVAVVFWAALFIGYYWYTEYNNLSATDVVQHFSRVIRSSTFGPMLFMGIYALRPLVLAPAWLLSAAGGFLFGPIWGLVYVLIGSNTSASLAYGVGRFFGTDVAGEEAETVGLVRRYATRMRENSFEAVLIMRILFVPYDLVNYLAGFMHMRWVPFILATAIGSLPGTLSFVLFGASVDGNILEGGRPSMDPWVLAASVVIFVSSLLAARYVKRRERTE